jgi:hypothetical protein
MKLMLDTECYSSKPINAGLITNRIIKHPVDITPEELAKEVTRGKSFVPGYFTKKVDGEIRRRIQCWTLQQIICLDFDNGMTLDQAIEEFKNTAMFIYTTFSHSDDHHKFRVVFATEKEIDDYSIYTNTILELMSKYPQVDQSCKDGSRLFYGGVNLIELNYDNRLKIVKHATNVDTKVNYNNIEGFYPYDRSKVLKSNSIVGSKTPSNISTMSNISKLNNNIIHINNRDIEQLQQLINPLDITFHTHEEVYNYLSKQDLGKFLGLHEHMFTCVFHEDDSPSANIFVNEETGHYVYKCFSESCTFKSGTIIKCVERLLKCNRVQALRFLRKVYKINYYETDWQKEQKEILDENMRYIRSDQFKQDYPELHKRIKNYLGELYILHSIARDNLPAEHYTEDQVNALFFASVRHIENLCIRDGMRRNADLKSMGNKLALFSYLGILFKLKEDDIPDILLKEAKKELVKNKAKLGSKGLKLTSFFEIPSYSDSTLTFGEQKAVEFKDKHLTMGGMSYEMLFRSCGENEANRVYPQMKGKKLSKVSEESSELIEDVTLNMIGDKGWTTEQEILEHVELRKCYKKKQIKRMLGEMLEKYGLMRLRLNKELKKRLNVDVDGYPFVIYRED